MANLLIDDTIPGVSAELKNPTVSLPIGSAGIVAVIGQFERGDGNTPYFIDDDNDGLDLLGDSEAYSGSSILPLIFKPDEVSNNGGAASAICVKAGAALGASYPVKDASSATVMTITLLGGLWGNEVKLTIAAGSTNGFKVSFIKGTDILESYDNIADAQALYNRLIAYSSIVSKITDLDISKTLANVAGGSFTGGTEVANPTVSDITAALTAIQNEDYDILIFTDVPDDTIYSSIPAYLLGKFGADNPAGTILPIDTTKTVSEAINLAKSINSMFVMGLVYQCFELDGVQTLNVAESAARYAGYVAGMKVHKSPTNKIMSDVTAVTPLFAGSDPYALTAGGITVFEMKSRKNKTFGAVSAVTTAQDTNKAGKKIYSEIIVPRTIIYVTKFMNLKDWLGDTDITVTLPSMLGELNSRKQQLMPKDDPIVQSLPISATQNAQNTDDIDVDIGIGVQDIVKHIRNRIQMVNG